MNQIIEPNFFEYDETKGINKNSIINNIPNEKGAIHQRKLESRYQMIIVTKEMIMIKLLISTINTIQTKIHCKTSARRKQTTDHYNFLVLISGTICRKHDTCAESLCLPRVSEFPPDKKFSLFRKV